MKKLLLVLAALAAVVLLTASVQAQPQRGGGPAMYLNAKAVQEELKLSANDAKKIADELGQLARDLKPEERADKVKKILSDGLKPEQVKRLHQIMWQRGGFTAASNNAEVQAALKLDDQQKGKIKSIRDDFQKQNAELTQGGAAQQNREKIQELRKKTDEDMTKVLTEAQVKAWKDLLGPEFTGQIGRQNNE